MNQDVTVRVKGAQSVDDNTEGIEVLSRGKFHDKGKTRYVIYEEVVPGNDQEPDQLSKTMIKIKAKTVEIIKRGELGTHMVFTEGETVTSLYRTPFGTLEITVDTKKLTITETDNEIQINIIYSILLSNQQITDCNVSICIQNR